MTKIADMPEPGSVVVVELDRAAHVYVRVVARAARGLRVSWCGVDYRVVGRCVGADLGRRPMWRAETFEPWQVATAAPPLATADAPQLEPAAEPEASQPLDADAPDEEKDAA